jgi:hypothetical protein
MLQDWGPCKQSSQSLLHCDAAHDDNSDELCGPGDPYFGGIEGIMTPSDIRPQYQNFEPWSFGIRR